MATAPTDEKSESEGFSLESLSERERKGLVVMTIVLVLLAGFVIVFTYSSKLGEMERDTRRYEQMLDKLALYAPQLTAEEEEETSFIRAKFDEDTLANNNLKLSSVVADRVEAVGVDVRSYDEKEIPIGGGDQEGGSLYVKKQLVVDISKAQADKVFKLLDQLEASEDPLVVKRVYLRERGKKPGSVRARLTVETYMKKKQEEGS